MPLPSYAFDLDGGGAVDVALARGRGAAGLVLRLERGAVTVYRAGPDGAADAADVVARVRLP